MELDATVTLHRSMNYTHNSLHLKLFQVFRTEVNFFKFQEQ